MPGATHRGRPGAEISPQSVHSAQSAQDTAVYYHPTGWDTQFQDAHDTAQQLHNLGRVRTAKFGAQQYFAWKAQKLPLPELWKPPGPGHRAYSTGATQGGVD